MNTQDLQKLIRGKLKKDTSSDDPDERIINAFKRALTDEPEQEEPPDWPWGDQQRL